MSKTNVETQHLQNIGSTLDTPGHTRMTDTLLQTSGAGPIEVTLDSRLYATIWKTMAFFSDEVGLLSPSNEWKDELA